MHIRKREFKYIFITLLLIIIAIVSRLEALEKNTTLVGHANQEKNTQDKKVVNCNDSSSDELSVLINRPQAENSCLNIGCGSFF